jgi:hypothetical protein
VLNYVTNVMNKTPLLLVIAASLLWSSSTAEAQLRRQDPATGERYKVEVAYGWWEPTPEISVSSAALGFPGDLIDFVGEFGFESKRFSEFRAVLRPARKHKFRVDYVPIKFDVEGAVLSRPITFNGQIFNVNLPVNVEASWNTWHFGYEYDFIYRDRGYLGLLLQAKYTKASIDLESPIAAEFTEVRAPIPTIGAVGRGYLARNVAITGEFSFFRLPENIDEDDDYGGHYYDFDIYGTINFTNNVGVTAGYRSLDVNYAVDFDFGDLRMKGYYVMGVVRF